MKLLKLITVGSTFLMIIINLLSNALPINNQTTAAISDSFKVYFVPAGYVFSIWGIIYIGLLAFNAFVLKSRSNRLTNKILMAAIVSNIANSVWIFLWHYNQPVISVLAMLILLISLIYIYLNFNSRKDLTKNEYYFVKIPFSIYLGWISVATIANITVALYSLDWNGFGISDVNWAVIMVIVAAALSLLMLLRHRDIFFSAVIVWALVGIGVKFSNIQILNITAFVCAIAIFVFVIYTIVKRFLIK